MFTMLLSVFVFNHEMTGGQWGGVGVVFAAIAGEAELKRREKRGKGKIGSKGHGRSEDEGQLGVANGNGSARGKRGKII